MSNAIKLLEGVKIVGFTQWLFGPAAGQYLTDMGADLVKVEPQGQGAWERTWAGGNTFLNGVSACFLATHRNARSIALDLKRPAHLEVAKRLVASSDVVLSNYRPGVMERLGLGYDELMEIRPDIIYACASGYGQDGPYAKLPGQDLLIQALSGMVWAGGERGRTPRPTGAAMVDQHAGLLLATGILGALVHRERTGTGQRVDVTMVEAALDLQLEPVTYHMNGGHVEIPHAPIGSAFHQAPYGVYATTDGHIVLSLNSMHVLADALGLTKLRDFDLDDVMARRDEIYHIIAPTIAEMTREKAITSLRAKGVWCAPVLNYDEMYEDPGVVHLDPFYEVEHPSAGRVRQLRHPIRYSSGSASERRPAPGPGQNASEVLAELGYTPAEVAKLLDQ